MGNAGQCAEISQPLVGLNADELARLAEDVKKWPLKPEPVRKFRKNGTYNRWMTLNRPTTKDRAYRQILGVRFFVGNAQKAVEIGARGGLVVMPAAPALLELMRDREYRQALLGADLVVTDSGFMVRFWNMMMGDSVQRVSGLKYLKLLLTRPEFQQPGAALWIMPTQTSLERCIYWLMAQGHPVRREDFYVAPKYADNVADDVLVKIVNQSKPAHVIIGVGGGVQEKLGFYLKRHCASKPAIHCIGAAIGFLTGDQVRIPDWADQWTLGWLFRCWANPGRFVPRYAKAFQLSAVLCKYRTQLPELEKAASTDDVYLSHTPAL